jgi:hypothetical protein
MRFFCRWLLSGRLSIVLVFDLGVLDLGLGTWVLGLGFLDLGLWSWDFGLGSF